MALNGSAVCYIIFQLPYPSAKLVTLCKKRLFTRFIIYTHRKDQETTCSYYLHVRTPSSTAALLQSTRYSKQYAQGHNRTTANTAQEARAARGSCLAHG